MENPILKTEKKKVYLVLAGNCHRIFRSEFSAMAFATEVSGEVFTNYIFV